MSSSIETTHVASKDLPILPNVSFLEPHSAGMLSSAYSVVQKKEGWNALANFKKGDAFMITEDSFMNDLMNEVNAQYNGGHSGSSMGWVMRQLESIARDGFANYKSSFTDPSIIHLE